MLNNYGAVLQAFALQYYLKQDKNLDVCNIDFRTSDHDQADKIFRMGIPLSPSALITFIFTCLRHRALLTRKKRTWKFKKTYFSFTKRYYNEGELLDSPPQMDIFISGSDQVFNPRGHNQKVYFLDFPKQGAKKIAYAASFGSVKTVTPEWEQKTFPRILDFDALSSREIEGAEYLSAITKQTVPCLVDPVFLLHMEQWDKVAVEPQIKGKYILVYDLNGGENLLAIADKIKQLTGFCIICITDKVTKRYKSIKQVYSAGPAEFVGLFKNAEYVVTDSFHGIVFSVIFNVKFFSFIAVKETASRIYNLLSLVNLSERIIDSPESLTDSIIYKKLDIDKTRLYERIALSKEYINLNVS